MKMLQVQGNKIVDAGGQPVQLRGTCVGGWMNMENFINGYPGSEYGLRARMAAVLGPAKGQFFFDRMLDYFFSEADIAFIKSTGSSVVRLPINYRHFELDEAPFQYLESGFKRLDEAIARCEKHGLYSIIDLHGVRRRRSSNPHSMNGSRVSLFWSQRQFQDRFVALWEALARRYAGNATVAGYNLMNEPVTGAPDGHYGYTYHTDWDGINAIYRRTVEAIRKIDPEHIIFLEGDRYSTLFEQLDAPFAPNLVYSSHNYTAGGFGPGAYPGLVNGERWDRKKHLEVFETHGGTRYAQKHNVPLWVGEFGSAYNGPVHENPDRIHSMVDQIGVYEDFGAHWTTWTYKDIDVMGWVQLDPRSEYMERIKPALRAKKALTADHWMRWLPPTPTRQKVFELAQDIEELIPIEGLDSTANATYLAQSTLSCYAATLLQPAFVQCFKDVSENDIDRIMQSFAFENCVKNEPLIQTIKKFTV